VTDTAPPQQAAKGTGTAAIVVVLAPEPGEVERVGVLDDDFRCEEHGMVLVRPAAAEFAVLRRRARNRLVKPAQRAERCGGDREVVAREEPPPTPLEGCVEIVDEELAGRRVGIGGEAIHRAPADQDRPRGGVEPCREGTEPIGGGRAVVVGEGQEIPPGARHAQVSRRCRTGVRLADEEHVEPVANRFDDGRGRRPAFIIDHDHLEAIAGIVESRE